MARGETEEEGGRGSEAGRGRRGRSLSPKKRPGASVKAKVDSRGISLARVTRPAAPLRLPGKQNVLLGAVETELLTQVSPQISISDLHCTVVRSRTSVWTAASTGAARATAALPSSELNSTGENCLPEN